MRRKQLIQRMRTILLGRRDALRQSLSGELGQFRTSDDPAVGDPIDAILDTEYAEVNSELAESTSRELFQIERALERVREGCYGVCEGCGRNIPVARLQALPYATMCIRCRQLCEKGRTVGSGPQGRFAPGDLRDEMDALIPRSFEPVE